MAKITFLSADISIEVDSETTLRDAAHVAGVDVHDRCGGMGACCNCMVRVVSGAEHLNPKTHLETPVFYLREDERLSCQCMASGDVVIEPVLNPGF